MSDGSPFVIVPVLSSTMTSRRCDPWSASPERMRTPCSAAFPIPVVSDMGVAIPSAQGQAMMSVVTMTIVAYAKAGLGPRTYQTTKPAIASMTTIGVKKRLTWSTIRWMGTFVACASWTRRTIDASAVSSPTRVARNVNAPWQFIVAPMTSSPTALSTGIDSPVIIDSSMAEAPLTIVPSTGMRSLGRTTTRSFTRTSSMPTVVSTPSRMTRAVRGRRPMSLRMASDVRPRALISMAMPSTTRAVTTALTS